MDRRLWVWFVTGCWMLLPFDTRAQGALGGLGVYMASREVSGGIRDAADSLREATAAARDIAAQAREMQDQFDRKIDMVLFDLDRKIAAIDQIGDDWILAVTALINETRLQIIQDMEELLDEVECIGFREVGFGKEQIDLLIPNALRRNSFDILLPFPVEEPRRYWFGTVERDVATISLRGTPDPRSIYDQIRTVFLDNIDTADGADSANDLVLAYGRLAMAARRTACFDVTPTRQQLMDDFVTFTAMQNAWMEIPELARALR